MYLRFVGYDEDDLELGPISGLTPLGEITEAVDKAIQLQHQGVGAASFTLDRHSSQRQWCRPGRYMLAYLTATRTESLPATSAAVFGFFVTQSDNTVLSPLEEGGEVYHRSGEGALSVLADAIVWYQDTTGNDSATPSTADDAWHWDGVNAGGIMVRMLEEAQDRGCFPFLSYDFTRTTDSNGDPWTITVDDFRLDIGLDLLSVAGDLQQLGLVFVMDPDFTLHAYESSTYGRDQTATVTFARGVNIATGADQNVIAAPARSTMLVKGKRGDTGATTWVEADSAAGLLELKRRKEGVLDAGTTSGYSALVDIGLDAIYQKFRLKAGPTQFGVYDTTLDPLVDYLPGDTVTVNVPNVWDSEEKVITWVGIADTEAGDADALVGFEDGPTYQSRSITAPPSLIATECCPPPGPWVPEYSNVCASATASGSHGPNLGATTIAPGNVFYMKAGSADPGLVPNPGYAGSWNFPAYNSGGVDHAGDCAGNVARCLVLGAGTITIHTATYSGSTRGLTASLYHVVSGTPTLDETKVATTGDDITFTVSNHSGAYCAHYVNVTDDGATCGGKWGFAGFDWVSTDSVLSNAPTAGLGVGETTAGDGATTAFTTNYPYMEGSLQVYVDGVLWGVTETDPTTGDFTFDSAPPSGSVIVITYQAASSTGTGAGNDMTPDAYTPPDLSSHLTDTSDAHDASAISIADAGGYYSGTDVEAALQQLAGGGIDYAEVGDLAAVGETASAGVSTEIPRADHVHTISADAVKNAGHWEVVVSGTAPPVAVSTPDDDDWVYAWVSG